MAAGDLTIIEEEIFGSQSIVIGTIELNAGAHGAGGYAPSAAKFGLTTVNFVDFEVVEPRPRRLDRFTMTRVGRRPSATLGVLGRAPRHPEQQCRA